MPSTKPLFTVTMNITPSGGGGAYSETIWAQGKDMKTVLDEVKPPAGFWGFEVVAIKCVGEVQIVT